MESSRVTDQRESKRESGPEPGRIWLIRIGLFLGAFFFLLLILEFGVRLAAFASGKGFFENPIYGFSSPFFTSPYAPQPHLRENESVFHGRVIAHAKPPNEIRILCFGGSTTVNARPGISYAELLEEKLDPMFPDHQIIVVRAATDSFSTAHTLVNLSLRCLDVSPDIITVYHNANDSSAIGYGDWVEPDYASKYMSPGQVGFRHRVGIGNALMKFSRLARVIESRVLQIRWGAFSPVISEARRQRGSKYFERNLRNIVAIAKENQIRVLLASQPARSDLRDEAVFRSYNAIVETVARENGVEFADIAQAIQEDELFIDQSHYTREGVRAVADTFLPHLETIIAELRSCGATTGI